MPHARKRKNEKRAGKNQEIPKQEAEKEEPPTTAHLSFKIFPEPGVGED